MNGRYPFAAAPDIIRSNEKDIYFQGILLERLTNAFRKLLGTRFVQTHVSEARTFTALLYFGCTTLLGNRTLGEEYCDVIQVEAKGRTLPSPLKRAGYILFSVLLPYLASRILPRVRSPLQSAVSSDARLEAQNDNRGRSLMHLLRLYLFANLEGLTSPSLLYGVSLAIFYFSGAYYHLSKRILGLRYIFAKNSDPSSTTTSYEVLGVLLLLQLSVQGWIHAKNALTSASDAADHGLYSEESIKHGDAGPLDVSKEHPHTRTEWRNIAMTPILQGPRYTLADQTRMKWVDGKQQRKCTLCLEETKDPSVTTCGHLFCWTCIADWIREKPECPLCRQSVQSQHVLPLR